jgi:hypothetical protein
LEVGHGHATQFFRWLFNLADQYQVTIHGYAQAMGNEGLDEENLYAWYKRLGFKFLDAGRMIREPRETKTAATYQSRAALLDIGDGYWLSYAKHPVETESNNWTVLHDADKLFVIGEVTIDFYPDIEYPSIRNIRLNDKHQGFGMGRRIVQALAKFYGGLTSDPQRNTNDNAVRMWKGIPGVEEVPSSKSSTGGTFFMLKAAKRDQIGQLEAQLRSLKPRFATAAQKVYEEWQQNEEGVDEMLGAGGICSEIANAIAEVIATNVLEANITEGGQEGDDHAWLVVYDETEAYGVDISPSLYETGAGYNWKKIPDVRFEASDVEIFPMEIDRESLSKDAAWDKSPIFLWAFTPQGDFKVNPDMTTDHSHWFHKMGLPVGGRAFDAIPRGTGLIRSGVVKIFPNPGCQVGDLREPIVNALVEAYPNQEVIFNGDKVAKGQTGRLVYARDKSGDLLELEESI